MIFKKSEIYKQEADLSPIKDQTPKQKFELIRATYLSKDNKLSLSTLCNLASVSRSGYYSWLNSSNDSDSYLNKKEKQDKKDFGLILTAYKFKGYDKGRRGIYMRLLHMGIKMNMKKISR